MLHELRGTQNVVWDNKRKGTPHKNNEGLSRMGNFDMQMILWGKKTMALEMQRSMWRSTKFDQMTCMMIEKNFDATNAC